MGRRSASYRSLTPTATADATNLVDSTYPLAFQGANSTQETKIQEVYISGQAASSAPTLMLLGRDSQVATGSLTADTTLNDGPISAPTAALAAPVNVFNKAATNKPQRSTTLGSLLDCGLNAFGGSFLWRAPAGGEVTMVGNTASLGELSLSAFTGGTPGLLGCHVIYETL